MGKIGSEKHRLNSSFRMMILCCYFKDLPGALFVSRHFYINRMGKYEVLIFHSTTGAIFTGFRLF